ncbi:ATP-binding protein [Iodobacter fluviatilis]|uniref:AAA domain-containing protein n=1 Tax=Iodobacter fluviatilis TaxID=537 RepID=A0A377Q9K5_9NEIS|nr:ATP-binding protein [Iodobacter fluviatilis]TCU81403.1 AAA domain-containing protein [Iodobacter fluviatilis]STQ91954.1 Transposon Tn7 transposition protein tnsC [Iodobacter fluviatilis]
MNNTTPIYATYTSSLVPEYQNNALIEALPPIWSEQDAATLIAHFPTREEHEHSLPKEIRLHCINRLRNIVQPLPIHLELESAISSLIRSGYVNRSPMDPATWRHLHTLSTDQRALTSFHSSASTFSLVGLSGIGKTTALESILRLYPQTILHKSYKSKEFVHTQIVWLKVECPFDGSLSGLCRNFFRAVDQALGVDKYAKRYQSKGGIPEMIQRMEQIATTYFVGAIFIDELQHLNAAKTGGKDNMLNFFVNLVNAIGIPVVFIGTNPMVELFADVLRNARRACGLGTYDFKQPNEHDPAWDLLVEAIWEYQWVNSIAPLTPAIRATLYDLTQGVTDFLAKLMILGQRYAIQSNIETLTEEVFKHVANTKMKLLKPLVAVLRSRDPKKMRLFEDLMPTDDQLNAMMEDAGVSSTENRLSVIRQAKKNSVPIVGPDTTAQAPQTLVAKVALPSAAISTTIAQAVDPIDILRKACWLQVDPLEFSDAYRKSA